MGNLVRLIMLRPRQFIGRCNPGYRQGGLEHHAHAIVDRRRGADLTARRQLDRPQLQHHVISVNGVQGYLNT